MNTFTQTPFTKPKPAAIIKQMTTAPKIGTPETISTAPSTLTTPATEPTERSMPPVSMTNVMPTEIMPVTATCRRIVNRVLALRNLSDVMENTTIRAARTITMP